MVALALSEGLHAEWDDVVIEGTGEGAFYRLSMESFDLVVLDVALPGRDGLQILKSIRQLGVKTPVLVLSARDTVQDRIAGLDAGADDYLVKPFAFAELLARIRALMRRGVNESPTLSIGDLAIDLLSRRVTVAGTAVELTTREVRAARLPCGSVGEIDPHDSRRGIHARRRSPERKSSHRDREPHWLRRSIARLYAPIPLLTSLDTHVCNPG